MEPVELPCAGCGVVVSKRPSEVRRQRRQNSEREFFCSLACYARARGRENLGEHLGRGNVTVLRADNRQDEYSPFRYFMRKARVRFRRTDLTLVYLKELWEQQGGADSRGEPGCAGVSRVGSSPRHLPRAGAPVAPR